MKKIIPFILLLVFINTGYSQFNWFKPKPKESPTPVVVEKSKSPIQDAKQIVKELQSELKVAKNENVKLKNSLSSAKNDLSKSLVQVDKLKKDIDTLKEWGVIQQAEAQKWLEKYNNAVKRYHKLKWIAALVAAAAGVLLGMQFMNLAPPPYNLLVPIGSAGLFGTLIWIFL